MCDLVKNFDKKPFQLGEWPFVNPPSVNLVVYNTRVTLTFEDPSIRFVYLAVCYKFQTESLHEQGFGVPSLREQNVSVDLAERLDKYQVRIRAYNEGNEGLPVCVKDIVVNVQKIVSDGALLIPA